mgnify:CR=1 FL=1
MTLTQNIRNPMKACGSKGKIGFFFNLTWRIFAHRSSQYYLTSRTTTNITFWRRSWISFQCISTKLPSFTLNTNRCGRHVALNWPATTLGSWSKSFHSTGTSWQRSSTLLKGRSGAAWVGSKRPSSTRISTNMTSWHSIEKISTGGLSSQFCSKSILE